MAVEERELPEVTEEPVAAEGEVVIVDQETMTLINMTTGEVVGIADTPPEGLDDIKFAEWIGERRAWHQGKAAGLIAEKQSWIDKINMQYDGQIKKHQNSVTWLEKTHEPFLMGLARKIIGEGKKRSTAIGLMMLQLRKTQAGVKIEDEDKSVAYIKSLLSDVDAKIAKWRAKQIQSADDPDIVESYETRISGAMVIKRDLEACLNIKETIYKSNLPEGLKADLTKDLLDKTGMYFDQGGEEKLVIK